MGETIQVRAVVEVPDAAIDAVMDNLREQHWQTFTGQFDRFNEREARNVATTAAAAVLHWHGEPRPEYEREAIRQFADVLATDPHANEIVLRFGAEGEPRWFIDGEDVTPTT